MDFVGGLIIQFLVIAAAVFVGTKFASLQPGSTGECAFCLEGIRRDAKVCRYCGRDVETNSVPTAESPDA